MRSSLYELILLDTRIIKASCMCIDTETALLSFPAGSGRTCPGDYFCDPPHLELPNVVVKVLFVDLKDLSNIQQQKTRKGWGGERGERLSQHHIRTILPCAFFGQYMWMRLVVQLFKGPYVARARTHTHERPHKASNGGVVFTTCTQYLCFVY